MVVSSNGQIFFESLGRCLFSGRNVGSNPAATTKKIKINKKQNNNLIYKK